MNDNSNSTKYVPLSDGFIGFMGFVTFLQSLLFIIIFFKAFFNGGRVLFDINYFGEGLIEAIFIFTSSILGFIWIIVLGFRMFGQTRNLFHSVYIYISRFCNYSRINQWIYLIMRLKKIE